jgi:hypothetical protein
MDEVITTLAAQLYTHAVEMAERPITGHFAEYGELNERWVSATREHLHSFLKLNAATLNEEWAEILKASETEESWEESLS